MENTTANLIIIVFTFVVAVLSIIILIQLAVSNLYFFVLRPSEAAALDIAGRITALAGSSGQITTNYKNITSGVLYSFIMHDKLVCVVATKSMDIVGGGLNSVNCYTTPLAFNPNLETYQTDEPESNEITAFHLLFNKTFDMQQNKVEISTEWLSTE